MKPARLTSSRAQPRRPASEGGRAPGVDSATLGDAGVMGEVGYEPSGRCRRTPRVAQHSRVTRTKDVIESRVSEMKRFCTG